MAITISDTEPRVQYTATAGQTNFSVPFEFFTNADIKVFNGSTQLSYNASPSSASQYSVSGAGVSGGGSITLGGSGATLNDTITIYRDLAIARSTDFPTSGAFQISSLNDELDKIIAMCQQLERDLKFSPKAAATTANTFDITFPNLIANKVLNVNSAGDGLEFGQDITDITTIAGIASDVTTVSGIAANVTTVAGAVTNVNTVASNITNVNTVATNIADVITVANDLTEAVSEIETVASDLQEASPEIDTVAGSISNVNNVGNNISNVNTVAGISANVTTVAGISSNVSTVAGISSDVSTVSGIASNVTTVANDGTDIGTVATNIANVNVVGGISSDVTTVSGISSNVTSVANNSTNINTVAGNNANIATVAGNNSNISTVAGISSNVTTVAGLSSEVTAVAGDATDIGTVATDLAGSDNIGTVATNITNINNVGGSITNVNTVAGNLSGVNYFGERYRVSATAPTTSLDVGDLYYDTATDAMKVYGTSGWQNAGSSVNGTSQRYNYTATSGQTTFSGSDNNGNTLTYDAGYIDVYLNGVKLLNGTDVTVTSGSSVVLASGATTGDVIDIVAYGTFSVATLNADNLSSGTVPSARVSGAYTGITQTGTLTSFTSTGIDDNATSTAITIDSNETSTLQCSAGDNNFALLAYHPTSTGTRTIAKFQSNVGGTQEDKVVIQTSGNVGIGTSSPSTTLDVEGTGVPVEINSSNSNTYKIQFADNGTVRGYIGSSSATPIRFADSSASELMRIDSSGNLLVGKTSTALGTAGTSIESSGRINVTRDGGNSAQFTRLNSDGNILNFYKDATNVGQIGSYLGSYLYMGSTGGTDTHINFVNGNVRPATSTGTHLDNSLALGHSQSRWSDVYVGGGVYLGGTGSANKLDDYEEGTWTPVFAGGSTNGTYTYLEQQGHYVKVGNLVTAWFNLTNITTSSAGSGTIQILGLPFSANWQSGFNGSGVSSLEINEFNNISGNNVFAILGDASSQFAIYKSSGTTNTSSGVPVTDKDSNSSDVRGFVTYYTGG
jgi:hypothetical protein